MKTPDSSVGPPAPSIKMLPPRAASFGWAHFKHSLVRLGVIENFDCDVPKVWQDIFMKERRK